MTRTVKSAPKRTKKPVQIVQEEVDNVKLIDSETPLPARSTVKTSASDRRSDLFDIMDAARNVSWLRASVVTIGRNLIGPGWKFEKVPEYEAEATDSDMAILRNFYAYSGSGAFKNIKDFYTTSGKMYATAVSLALMNFASWEIRKNKLNKKPIGFDYIPGIVEPNVDGFGNFLKPAFIQYLSDSVGQSAEWNSPDDIVFFVKPDFGGQIYSSDIEALVSYAIPSDIYASLSWLSMQKNRSAPLDGYWIADAGMSDSSFKKLETLLRSKYSGAKNYARAPILSRGALEFQRIQRSAEEAPYMEGRDYARQEMAAVLGVPGSKLGVTKEMSRASDREAKRAYIETILEPMQKLIEETTYNQIHMRLFSIRGWRIKFNNPAFVNELEQASIDRTYWNIGAKNANEIRAETFGLKPREGGDEYFQPANMVQDLGELDSEDPAGNKPGDPALGPDDESPAGANDRPVRSDEQGAVAELEKFRKFVLARMKSKTPLRPFKSNIISKKLQDKINAALIIATDEQDVKEVFRMAKSYVLKG